MRKRDLAKARRDLSHFARLVGWPLTPWQAAALILEAKSTVLLASRQMGKSRSLALLAVWWSFRRADQRTLVVSAGEDSARRLLAMMREIVTGSELLVGSAVEENAGRIVLSNGSRIDSIPQSERAARGRSSDLVLADEAALMDEEFLEGAVIPTVVARPDARIVLASTPHGATGTFYRHAMAGMGGGSDHVQTFRWKPKAVGGDEDAPWITPAVIAHQRAVLDSRKFGREYELKFSAASDQLFETELIERRAVPMKLPTLDAVGGAAALWIGCDWGTVRDRSVCVAIARLPVAPWNPRRVSRRPIYVAWTLKAWPSGTPNDQVVAEIASSPATFDAVSSEVNSLGFEPTRALFSRLGVTVRDRRFLDEQRGLSRFATRRVNTNRHVTTAPRKAACYSAVLLLLERGQLYFAEGDELIDELLGLRTEMRPSGNVSIEAGTLSGRDDLADALAIATCSYDVRGRTVNLLTHLAERESPEASLPSTALQAETFETADGLVLPREPWLQSVRGEELTAPAITFGDPEDDPNFQWREQIKRHREVTRR